MRFEIDVDPKAQAGMVVALAALVLTVLVLTGYCGEQVLQRQQAELHQAVAERELEAISLYRALLTSDPNEFDVWRWHDTAVVQGRWYFDSTAHAEAWLNVVESEQWESVFYER